MMKLTRIASFAAVVALAAGAGIVGFVSAARAVSTSDKPAAILVWPKIVVDTLGRFGTCTSPQGLACSVDADCAIGGGVCNTAPTDTIIQLSNTSTDRKQAHCFLVNANSYCEDNPAVVCRTARDCPSGGGFAACVPGWNEIDFNIILTPGQPLGWAASQGLSRGSFPIEGPGTCASPAGRICFRDQDCATGSVCNIGPNNLGSGIPAASDDPFVGSLTCIEYDPQANPPVPDRSASTNSLKGEATITLLPPAGAAPTFGVDVQKYNAVGLQATAGPASGPANQLQLGGFTGAEYAACPNTLILNHLFDGASDPISVGPGGVTGNVRSDLTLIPCGTDYLSQTPGSVTAQFLVFNEFEQRFSTSRAVDCFLETQLSNIDTPNPTRSIFSAGVSGTIAGQTRIRGVGSAASGRGLLGVAQLFVMNTTTNRESGAAYNLHQQGDPEFDPSKPNHVNPDIITLP